MNFDELQKDRNSPRNNLPKEQHLVVVEKFARQMVRRRRFQTFWLIHTFIWLTLITGLAIWLVVVGKANFAHEWGLFPLLLVPWAFAIHFLRRHLKPAARANGESPFKDSLSAALISNRTYRSHLKLVGVMFLLMIPLLAVGMQQLHAVGKVSARELTSMALFFGVLLSVCGAGIAARYFGHLLPEQKQLEELLGQFHPGATN